MHRFNPIKSGIVEFLGCFALMFFGTFQTNMPDDLKERRNFFYENAIINLFIYMVMMWLGAKYSGSQFNPMLSLSLLSLGEIPFSIAIVNLASQAAGAFFGLFYLGLVSNYQESYFNSYKVGMFAAIFIEFLVSFTLSLVYFITFCHKQADRSVYAFAVPAVYAMFTISIGNLFYTRFNLILFIAHSVLSFDFQPNFFSILIGSILGSTVALILYIILTAETKKIGQALPMTDEDNQIKF